MKKTTENCTSEIDSDRGVIYVHHPDGYTALRICGLLTMHDVASGDRHVAARRLTLEMQQVDVTVQSSTIGGSNL